MPKAYTYVRVSKVKQAKEGVSLDAQQGVIAEEYPKILRNYAGIVIHPEPFVDAGVSARKFNFFHRPEGKRLWDLLRAGDVILVTRLDRVFRSAQDALNTVQMIKDRGATIHFVEQNIRLDEPIGHLLFTVLSAVAEFESSIISERIKEAMDHLRSQGIPGSGHDPYGYKIIRVKNSRDPNGKTQRVIRVDLEERTTARLVVTLRDEHLFSFRKIGTVLYDRRIPNKRAGLTNRPEDCLWTYTTIENLYKAATAGFPLPNGDRWDDSGSPITPPDKSGSSPATGSPTDPDDTSTPSA